MLRSCVHLRGEELKRSAFETAHRSWCLKFLIRVSSTVSPPLQVLFNTQLT